MPQIICRNVTLGYNGITVCENLNFKVNVGDYLCIVGDNGSGKTTLMKALLGLKTPESGEILWDKHPHRGCIGYLPQQSDFQRDFPATADEVVLSGCVGALGKRFFYTKKDRSLAKKNMKKLGISELGAQSYGSLSGGQQQRVLLARALCAAKDTILLDEPVSGLDPASTAEMYELISKLNKDNGITVIMITHDIGAAVRYADRVLHMGEHPQFFDTVEEYRKSSAFELDGEARDE